MCESGAVEDEIHFLFHCRSLRETSKGLLLDIGADGDEEEDEEEEEREDTEGEEGSDEEEEEEGMKVSDDDCINKLKELVKEEKLKELAEDLEIMFNAHQRILYK